MARSEIFTGPERRRSWSEGAEAGDYRSGVCAGCDCRRCRPACGGLRRADLSLAAGAGACRQRVFRVVIAAMEESGNVRAAPDRAPAIEVEFAGTAWLSIPALTPPELAAAVIRALRR